MILRSHRVAIERPRSTGTNDDGDPILEYDQIAEVDASIQPKNAREVAQLAQAGAEISDHTIHLDRTDVTAADRLRDVTSDPDGPIYQISGIRDYAFGTLAHLEVDARRVNAPTIVEGS